MAGRGEAIFLAEVGVMFAVFGVDVAGVLEGVAILPDQDATSQLPNILAAATGSLHSRLAWQARLDFRVT